MPLTSYQKHYIKKNISRLSMEEIANNLNLPLKEISRYTQKRWGDKNLKKLNGRINNNDSQSININDFRIKSFLADNINYFILLFVLVSLTYFGSLNNEFVSDDIPTILKNPNIGELSSTTTRFMVGSLHNITNYLIFKIFGTTPAPFRLVNIICHLGSTWIIFILFSLMTKKRVALITASIFAVHPILAEAVSWISGGPYSLSAFFILLTFLLYVLSENNKKLYYLSVVSFIFAFFSADKIMYFPFAMVVYEFSLGNIKKNWKRLIPFLSITIFIILNWMGGVGERVRTLNQDFYQNAGGMDNPILKSTVAITTYLKLMFFANGFSLYQTELTFSRFQFAVRVIILLIYLGLIGWGWKKNRLIFFWLSFMIMSLATSLTPFKIAWVVAERYVYLGSVGVFFSFAFLLVWLMEKNEEKNKYYFYGFVTLIILALIIRTNYRNIDWKNEDNLWQATVKVSPSGAPIHNNMGDVYARHNDYQKAIEEFTKATKINPGYADAYHNLANVYQMSGNIGEAEKYYTKALSINPKIWQSWQNLAAIYSQYGNREKATECIQKAIAINPTDAVLQNNLKIIQGDLSAIQSTAPAP